MRGSCLLILLKVRLFKVVSHRGYVLLKEQKKNRKKKQGKGFILLLLFLKVILGWKGNRVKLLEEQKEDGGYTPENLRHTCFFIDSYFPNIKNNSASLVRGFQVILSLSFYNYTIFPLIERRGERGQELLAGKCRYLT